ncbi:MAG: hypothetical protein ACETV0_08655 [Nitrososphaeria archaeon]
MVSWVRIGAALAFLVLGSLGALFLIASAYATSRLLTGGVMIAVALVILYLGLKYQAPVVQKVEVEWAPGGPVETQALKCPNCGAPLPPPDPKTGTAACVHCGWRSKVSEEPLW